MPEGFDRPVIHVDPLPVSVDPSVFVLTSFTDSSQECQRQKFCVRGNFTVWTFSTVRSNVVAHEVCRPETALTPCQSPDRRVGKSGRKTPNSYVRETREGKLKRSEPTRRLGRPRRNWEVRLGISVQSTPGCVVLGVYDHSPLSEFPCPAALGAGARFEGWTVQRPGTRTESLAEPGGWVGSPKGPAARG